MLLEGFLSGVVGNVLKELFTRAFDKKGKSVDEKDVERIVATYLLQYHLALQSSTLGKEIYLFMGTSGLVSSGGQLLLPASREALEPTLQRAYERWWDRATYKITSILSEKVLDVSDWRTENWASIIQHDYHEGANQRWRLIPVNSDGDLFKIISQHSGKVLDVSDCRTENGVPIIQYHYHGGMNQHWRLNQVGGNDDIFRIVSEYSGKVLDVSDWRTENGAVIIQYEYHGGTNQHWRLSRVN